LTVAATINGVDVVAVRPAVGLVYTLVAAYRRAVRHRRSVVSSADVLRAGVPRVPELRQFPRRWSRDWRMRTATGDQQPSAPASSLFPAFDRQVALFADAALREAAYRGGPAAAEFSPLVARAVYEAIHEASRRDGVPAGVRHLLAAIAAEPGNAAAQLTERMWIVGHGGSIVDRQSRRYRAGDPASGWVVPTLTAAGVLPPGARRPMPLAARLLLAAARGSIRWTLRRGAARSGHPMLSVLESDAGFWAVRLGRPRTGTVELLLGILDIDEQLRAAGKTLPEPLARHNAAAAILCQHGLTLLDVVLAAAQLPSAPPPVACSVPRHSAPRHMNGPAPKRGSRRRLPPLDAEASRALSAARTAAQQAGDPVPGTRHVLAAILRDHGGAAADLLRRVGTDPAAIAAETASHD
jgi:hypothetical protein